ncbi:MAG TPA: hypothetical protein VFQ53_30260 [Kofleriaceae bacterium]|nr:hypothetical protein [Kofleriaceae bacterium]
MMIKDASHAGLAAIEVVHRRTRLVVVHEVGPRIAWFGAVGGANLLFWDDANEHARGGWRLRGGHRLWVTRPLADEAEETYAPDNVACRVRRTGDRIAITAPPDPSRIEKTLAIRTTDDGFVVEHRLRNTGDMLWSGGAWALTCTKPARDTRYRIPLDGGDPGWDVVRVVIPRRWGGTHTSRLADPQFAFTDDALEFRARGDEAKRMVFAPRGTLEMVDPARGTFVKSAPVIADAAYPEQTNLAVYLGPKRFMVELETMSPIVSVRPGRTLVHVETWRYQEPTKPV